MMKPLDASAFAEPIIALLDAPYILNWCKFHLLASADSFNPKSVYPQSMRLISVILVGAIASTQFNVCGAAPQRYAEFPVPKIVVSYLQNPNTETTAILQASAASAQGGVLVQALKESIQGDFARAKRSLLSCISQSKLDVDKFVRVGSVCWKVLIGNELAQGNVGEWLNQVEAYKNFSESNVLPQMMPGEKLKLGEFGAVDVFAIKERFAGSGSQRPGWAFSTKVAPPNANNGPVPIAYTHVTGGGRMEFAIDTGSSVSSMVPSTVKAMGLSQDRAPLDFWAVFSPEAKSAVKSSFVVAHNVTLNGTPLGSTAFVTSESIAVNYLGLPEIVKLGRVRFSEDRFEMGPDLLMRSCESPLYFLGDIIWGRMPAFLLDVDGKPTFVKFDSGSSRVMQYFVGSAQLLNLQKTVAPVQIINGMSQSTSALRPVKVNGLQIQATLVESQTPTDVPMLGTGILKEFDVEFDFGRRTACLFPAGAVQ